MEKHILITLYILLNFLGRAQEIQWARNTSADGPAGILTKGLLCDNQGFVYSYGANEYGLLDHHKGSFFNKYAMNGDILFTRSWDFPFCIQKMVYDGSQYMYVVGSFTGTSVIDNIVLSSKGQSDGFVGKMDLNGNFKWIKTLGGNGMDICKGVNLNLQKTKVILTGGISDSLFVNGNLVELRQNKTMLIARFDLQGNLADHKLYDFVQERNEVNCGQDIATDNAGDIILFGEREGKHWYNDSITAPDQGFYMFKFNQDLQLQWSKFVISSACYYGFSCGGLSVDNYGCSYISSFCSGKYGGSGFTRKYNSSGSITWSISTVDATGYLATPVNDQLFLAGIDGSDGCPCEGHHMGYQVIKKMDSNHNLKGETRMRNIQVTSNPVYCDGFIYVSGIFYGDGALVGKDTLKNPNNVSGSFLIQLRDIDCAPLATDDLDNFYKSRKFCPQNNVVLDAGAGYFDYLWSNGATTQTMSTNIPGYYSARVTLGNGCKAYSLPQQIESVFPQKQEMFLVGFDNASKRNKTSWYQFGYEDQAVSFYNLYKTVAGQTLVLTQIAPTTTAASLKYFTDSSSVHDNSQVGYYMTRIDTCGNESVPGTMYSPVFLRSEASTLIWTPYLSNSTLARYFIAAGPDPEHLQAIDHTPTTQTTYNKSIDTNFYYQVKVEINEQLSSYSNIVKGSGLGVGLVANNLSARSLKIFPNPSTGNFVLDIMDDKELGEVNLKVTNVMGQSIKNKTITVKEKYYKTELDLSSEGKGIYFVQMQSEGKERLQKRVVVQ
jgi:hypothetical protein